MLKKIKQYLADLNDETRKNSIKVIDLSSANDEESNAEEREAKKTELIARLATLSPSGYATHSVRTLHLNGFTLTDADLFKLTQTNITILCLKNCTINKIGGATIPRHSNLTCIDLEGSKGEGLNSFVVSFICVNSPALTAVNLRSTSFPPDRIMQLELLYNKSTVQPASPPRTPTSSRSNSSSSSSIASTATADSSPRDKTSPSKNDKEQEQVHLKKSKDRSSTYSVTEKKKPSSSFSLSKKLPSSNTTNPRNDLQPDSPTKTFK